MQTQLHTGLPKTNNTLVVANAATQDKFHSKI